LAVARLWGRDNLLEVTKAARPLVAEKLEDNKPVAIHSTQVPGSNCSKTLEWLYMEWLDTWAEQNEVDECLADSSYWVDRELDNP
jgi:hypothetical protein